MNEIIRPQPVVGSITPQLEGASQSESHLKRTSSQTNSKAEKGGKKDE